MIFRFRHVFYSQNVYLHKRNNYQSFITLISKHQVLQCIVNQRCQLVPKNKIHYKQINIPFSL